MGWKEEAKAVLLKDCVVTAEALVPALERLRALGQLAGGRSVDQLLADYPYLEHEDVLAALEYAAAVVDQRELPLARSA